MTFLYDGTGMYSAECNIMALVYINRLCATGHFPLTFDNWRSVWLIVIMIAQKVWDDQPVRTSGFARLIPEVTTRDLRELEFKTLNLLQFLTGVKPSLYARYYFQLREMYVDIAGSSDKPAPEWDIFTAFTKSKLTAKNEKCEEIRLKQLSNRRDDLSGLPLSTFDVTP